MSEALIGGRPARGVIVIAASEADVDDAREVAIAVAANLRYLHGRAAQVGPSEGPGVFSVVDGGALDPAAAAERGLPVLLVANGAADAPGYAAAGCDVLGIIARSHDVPGEHVLGVYPPIPGPGPDDPLWLAKAADMLESHVDLWPLLRIAQPG